MEQSIKIEILDEPDKCWNQRLLGVNTGTFFQTKEYIISEQIFGNKPLFLEFINNNGKIVGQLGLVLYPFLIKKGIKGKILHFIPNIKSVLARWIYGPVIFDFDYQEEIKNELRKFLMKKNFKVWGSEHPFSYKMLEHMKSFSIKQWATFVIDLKSDSNAIWNKMEKHSARKNIERSLSRNVIVKPMKKDDLVDLYHLEMNNSKIDNSITLSHMEMQWDILQPVKYSGFMAYLDDKPIGAMKFSSFNNYINEFEIVRDKLDYNEKLYSQDLIKWNLIELGINNNCNYYDLSGVNPTPISEKDKGIYRYKEKWGGTLMKYNILSM